MPEASRPEAESPTTMNRRMVMSALALAPTSLVKTRYEAMASEAPVPIPVRGPEVGLVMLRGRAGGGGGAFNLGEASVCRATVRLESGEVGHAMILGRDREKASIVAHCDALWQHPDWRERIEAGIVAAALESDADDLAQRAREAEATRVDFFTLARGED